MEKITSAEGKVFQRKHDGVIFGSEIYLGVDYSTGAARDDKAEYYDQVDKPEELTVNIDDESWFEIDKPEESLNIKK